MEQHLFFFISKIWKHSCWIHRHDDANCFDPLNQIGETFLRPWIMPSFTTRRDGMLTWRLGLLYVCCLVWTARCYNFLTRDRVRIRAAFCPHIPSSIQLNWAVLTECKQSKMCLKTWWLKSPKEEQLAQVTEVKSYWESLVSILLSCPLFCVDISVFLVVPSI